MKFSSPEWGAGGWRSVRGGWRDSPLSSWLHHAWELCSNEGMLCALWREGDRGGGGGRRVYHQQDGIQKKKKKKLPTESNITCAEETLDSLPSTSPVALENTHPARCYFTRSVSRKEILKCPLGVYCHRKEIKEGRGGGGGRGGRGA